MFSPFDYVLWAVIFILESAAAYLTFPRQKVLSSLLAFRAAADLLGMVLLGTAGMTAFQWEDYLQRMIQFPILGILGVYCAGAAAGDSRGVRMYSAPFAAVIAIAVGVMHGVLPWSLLTAAWIVQKTVFGIAAIVALALILRQAEMIKEPMPKPWGTTSAGLLVLLGSYALGWMAIEHHWARWMTVSRGMQFGAIAAYLIWVAGPLRTLRIEKRVQEQFEFGKFLIVEDRNPVNNRMVM